MFNLIQCKAVACGAEGSKGSFKADHRGLAMTLGRIRALILIIIKEYKAVEILSATRLIGLRKN